MDRSYHEEGEARGQKVKVYWMDGVGDSYGPESKRLGAYIIEFPGAKGSSFDQFPDDEKHNEYRLKGALMVLTARPDLAKHFFHEALRLMNQNSSKNFIENTRLSLRSKRDDFNRHNKNYLWIQDPKTESPNIFFQKEAKVNGIQIETFWHDDGRVFEIQFPYLSAPKILPYLEINQKTEDAIRVFEYACQRAKVSHDALEVRNSVLSFIHDLNDND
jgi:hypothetical protein